MQAARATPASATPPFVPIPAESDGEDDTSSLALRRRVRSGGSALEAKGSHLRAPVQGSLPPQRPAPSVPAAGRPSAGGRNEPMLAVQDIPLKTRPTVLPAPQRPAPPIPTAGKPALPAGDIVLQTQSLSLLERQRPAPVSTVRTPVAEPADTEVFYTAPSSPAALTWRPSPFSLSPLAFSSTLTPPSLPSSPEAHAPVQPSPDNKGKAKESPPPTPPSAEARASAAPPTSTTPASPTEAVLHPAQGERADVQAELFAKDIETLMSESFFRHGQPTVRGDFNFMHGMFERNAHFLDMGNELLNDQKELINVLERGDLSRISQPRLRKLVALAGADIDWQLRKLSQLKADLADARQDIVNGGGDPKWISQPAPPKQEIDARQGAAVARHTEQINEGYGF